MNSNNKDIINIFDFDGTLTTETWPKFWVWVKKFGYSGERRNNELETALSHYRNTHSGNKVETFFGFFNDLLISSNKTITQDELMEGEKYIQYSLGLKEFLSKTDTKNYIVSGGLKEFLQNLKIAVNFCGVYGTSVNINKNGEVSSIDEIMTDDKKILAICDILKRHNREEKDCNNVYYIGDGYSDAPAMKFVHDNGGKSIFVVQPNQNDEFQEENKKIYERLNYEGVVDFYCMAYYSDGSTLSKVLERKLKI